MEGGGGKRDQRRKSEHPEEEVDLCGPKKKKRQNARQRCGDVQEEKLKVSISWAVLVGSGGTNL